MNLKRLTLNVILLCISTFLSQIIFAQNKVITGKVTDSSGGGVQGASITVKGSRGGVQTNADGNFTISVPSNASTIIVSSVGFERINICLPEHSGRMAQASSVKITDMHISHRLP